MERNRTRILHTTRGRKTTTGTLVRTRAENIRNFRASRERLEIFLRDKAFRECTGYDYRHKAHSKPRQTNTPPVGGAPYRIVPSSAWWPTVATQPVYPPQFYEIDRDAKWLWPAPAGCLFPTWNRILTTPEPGAAPRQFEEGLPRRRGNEGGYRVFEEPNPLIFACPGCFERHVLAVTVAEGAKWLVRQAQEQRFAESYRSAEHTESVPIAASVQRMPRWIYASDFIRENHSKFTAPDREGGEEQYTAAYRKGYTAIHFAAEKTGRWEGVEMNAKEAAAKIRALRRITEQNGVVTKRAQNAILVQLDHETLTEVAILLEEGEPNHDDKK